MRLCIGECAPADNTAMLHLAVDRRKNLRLRELALQEFGSVENVVDHAGLRFILPDAIAIHEYLAAIHEGTPRRAQAPRAKRASTSRQRFVSRRNLSRRHCRLFPA